MRIAFASQEYPPDTGGGGIGTYLAQVTAQLAATGHAVTVFCGAGPAGESCTVSGGVTVQRIAAGTAQEFRARLVRPVTEAHRIAPFDVLEGNDFDAPALAVRQALPGLACVVKLHTPRFVIDELHTRRPRLGQRWRMALGALRRGRWPQPPVPVRREAGARAELAMLELADEIAAPSQAVADAAVGWLPSLAGRISVFPYPYQPAPALLRLPAGGRSRRITFVGRIEERKGILDLAAAIPLVLAACPEARFRFVGRSMPFGNDGGDLRACLESKLAAHAAAVEFTGPLPPAELPRILGETDILAAPSHWESFGLVCCEGLAAARAVIGSSQGGMAEILDQGRCGVLVPPQNPAELARAILGLLGNPARAEELGQRGRARILDFYSPVRVLAEQLASYERARLRCAATP